MGPIKKSIGPYREQWSKSNSPIWISKNATVELSNNLKSLATPLPFFPHIDINWNPSHKPDSVLNIRFGYHRDIGREIRNGGVVLLKEKKKEKKTEKWKRKPGGSAQLERGDPKSDGAKGFCFLPRSWILAQAISS